MSGKRILIQLVKVTVSVGLIAFLFHKLSPENLLADLSRVRPWQLVISTVIFFVSAGLGAYQWHLLLKAGGIALPFPKTFKVYFVGLFFNNFLPAGVGGDVMKIYDVTRVGNDPHQVFAVTMLDRVIGITGLCILALAASFILLTGEGLYNLYLYIIIFAGCVAPVLALIMNKRLSRGVRRLFGRITLWGLGGRFDAIFRHLGEYRRLRMLLVRLTVLAMAVQFLRVVTHVLVAQSLGITVTNLHFVQFFVFVPLLSLIMILPISINGLGVREGAGVLLFTQIGFSKEQALLMELITYAIMVMVSLVGGFFFLQRSFERKGGIEPQEVHTDV
ncbi:MAG: lysylphosphatidylglycerol synthase transmembrane domain-containing protein [Candidatus Krumholzibacteria bacterium]|nr:lysylphosphatidylglycerol synthase transmembrane domain-containing protein [Candidatus Krumholzibacteria bacterium]